MYMHRGWQIPAVLSVVAMKTLIIMLKKAERDIFSLQIGPR